MRTETGIVAMLPKVDHIRVSIPRYVFRGAFKDNLQFRVAMSILLRENCNSAMFEYPDDVTVYPHALWIDKELAVIFKLKWAL